MVVVIITIIIIIRYSYLLSLNLSRSVLTILTLTPFLSVFVMYCSAFCSYVIFFLVMCVLFCCLLLPFCVYVPQQVYCRSTIVPGAWLPPYYCAPLVYIPKVQEGVAEIASKRHSSCDQTLFLLRVLVVFLATFGSISSLVLFLCGCWWCISLSLSHLLFSSLCLSPSRVGTLSSFFIRWLRLVAP